MLSALRSGDISELSSLLDLGLDCDITFRLGGWSRPAVCLAVERGHGKLVEELCARRCSTSMLDHGGLTPLHLAAILGFTDIARMLIANRADINCGSSDSGDTPLHLATAGNHHEVVQLLLEHGAAVDHPNADGRTCLMYAGAKGYYGIAQLLVEYGADCEALDKCGNTALMLHCSSAWLSAELTKLLSCSLRVMNLSNNQRSWPVLEIVQSTSDHKHEALVAMTKLGADLNVTSILGSTPLHTACYSKDWCSAVILVRAGAEMEYEDYLGQVPLYIVLKHDHLLLAALMRAGGARCLINSEHQDKLSEKARTWLKNQRKKTQSLKDISRLALRQIMSERMEQFLQQAEMPSSLKQYVYYLLE